MKSFSIVGLSLLASVNVFASQLPNPVARYTENNGPVAPTYAWEKTCEIYADETYHATGGPAMEGTSYFSLTTYTHEIPDYATAVRAVKMAYHGVIEVGQAGPNGGGQKKFEGVLTVGAGAPLYVLLASKGFHNDRNLSKATAPLIRFIKANCFGQ
jgi:hypothetical protein